MIYRQAGLERGNEGTKERGDEGREFQLQRRKGDAAEDARAAELSEGERSV